MVGNFFDRTREAIRTGLCNYVSAVDKGRSWVNELSPADLPNFTGYFNRLICDDNEPFPSSPLPFNGGQCPGVAYLVSYGFFQNGGPVTELGSSPKVFIGPVTFFDNSDEFSIRQGIEGSQGESASVSISRVDEPAGFVVISISRVDGQPDDCGNLPPSPFPPGGDTTDIDITYVNNDGDTVTELGDLIIFAPVVIAPVTVVAPIRVDLPDVSFDGQIVLSPDFNIELSPPPFGDGPGDVGEDDDPPPEDSRRSLLGVRCRCSNPEDTNATQVFGFGNAPDLWVPRLASVVFEVRVGDEVTRSQDYDLKQTDQFFPVPDRGLVTRYFVTPIPGASVSAQAVYGGAEVPATS